MVVRVCVRPGLRRSSEAQDVDYDERAVGRWSVHRFAGVVLLLLHEANKSTTTSTTTVSDAVFSVPRRLRHNQRYVRTYHGELTTSACALFLLPSTDARLKIMLSFDFTTGFNDYSFPGIRRV